MTLGRVVALLILAAIIAGVLQFTHLVNFMGQSGPVTPPPPPGPAAPVDYYAKGSLAFNEGHWPETVENYSKALQLGPKDERAAEGEFRLAFAWDRQNNDRKARDAYKVYLDKNPQGGNWKEADYRYEQLNLQLGGH